MGSVDRGGASARFLTPLVIAGIYAVCGVAWILLSDRALALLPIDQLVRWETLKGLS